ncbi:tetratricopeptide repeat protein [Ideonella alba]|uniref:Tetratricopeptide repeat protein n=1 Tax=Ideonella alba TaxID=2824118 RepID=A0A940YFL4_9BURK|nr:tetratricopeptide repeat protein [Ideonella alba]MBQ0931580.1 tetratricopeptide repeat protein [Ideonella alba]
MRRAEPALLIAALALAGCASGPLPGDDQPTLKALAQRPLPAVTPGRLPTDEQRALAAWQALLAAQPDAKQRAQALRRLGDLEMDATDARLASQDGASADYRAAIARYQTLLKETPNDPGNDRVLYQLARAQELGGDAPAALATLDRLVATYPQTTALDEAQFRRGELLFSARRYAPAEAAFGAVLASPRPHGLTERARYMQGWSQFKQARLEPALGNFMAVLDTHLAGRDPAVPVEQLPGLSRANRELVDDVLRVIALALENLQGVAAIAPLVDSPQRAGYAVRLYQNQAALYLKQDRPKDAADALGAFVRRAPQDPMAPLLQAQVVRIHAEAGFEQQALAAKLAFVEHYGLDPAFKASAPEAWQRARPLVREFLGELAQRHHAAAQKSHQAADVQAAVRWYQALLAQFPDDADSPRQRFLLAELLFEDRQYDSAAAEYERSAYQDPPHPRSAEAGYAALLAHDARLKAAPDNAALAAERLSSALRFAERHAADPRAAAVLADAAERQLRAGQAAQAQASAARVLAWQPEPAAPVRRSALGVQARAAFDAGRFADAERATQQVLALTPDGDASRAALNERLAAAIYRQAEAARDGGQGAQAAALFAKVGSAAPGASIRANADFDAATQWIALKDWPRAAEALEAFRRQHPGHALQAQVPARLALAYDELQRPALAAAEYERVATSATEPEARRTALWLAAQRRESAQDRDAAATWERYLKAWPRPLPEATEARAALARHARSPAQALAWQRELLASERAGGSARTARSRLLSAQAALALARPADEACRAVALTEPLAKSLALKKTRLEAALQAWGVAAEDGVAEGVTAATFASASLYQEFGQALLKSQRPKKLSKAEREQYDVLLEEQAYPFEEKAIALHEANAARVRQGQWDEPVRQSLAALRTLRPARWAKAERRDEAAGAAAQLNREAIALREQGKLPEARARWQQALAAEPGHAASVLNLGVLLDLYLDEPVAALAQYQRYLELTPGGDAQVGKWVAELKPRAAKAAAPVKKEAT